MYYTKRDLRKIGKILFEILGSKLTPIEKFKRIVLIPREFNDPRLVKHDLGREFALAFVPEEYDSDAPWSLLVNVIGTPVKSRMVFSVGLTKDGFYVRRIIYPFLFLLDAEPFDTPRILFVSWRDILEDGHIVLMNYPPHISRNPLLSFFKKKKISEKIRHHVEKHYYGRYLKHIL